MKRLEFYQSWHTKPVWWFHSTPALDANLAKNYGHLLNQHTSNQKPHIASVIIHDQLARHVARHIARNEVTRHIAHNKVARHTLPKTLFEAQAFIQDHLAKALDYATKLWQTTDVTSLSDTDFTFLLLPFRHTNDPKQCMWAAQMAWQRIKEQNLPTPSTRLKSFLKATYKRMPMDQSDLIEHPSNISIDWNHTLYTDVLEYAPTSIRWLDVSLLDVPTVTAALKGHPLNTSPLIVSLSGGVDSMVLAAILRRLFPDRHLIAVHIDYCNRTPLEERLVHDWAQILGMPYYVRKITEIQKAPAMQLEMRATYETYTRDVRYETYRHVWRLETQSNSNALPQVLLGHNQDDALENILTNIAHGEQYHCLRGMRLLTTIANIDFHRPLLNVTKADIYNAARALGVPYLQDSTPSWCKRGQIRDVVRPCLEGWDANMTRRLLDLADVLGETSAAWTYQVQSEIGRVVTLLPTETHERVWSWTCTPSTPTTNGHCIATSTKGQTIATSPRFWREFFQALLGITVSWKSLSHYTPFVERLIQKGVGAHVMVAKGYDVVMRAHTPEELRFIIRKRCPPPHGESGSPNDTSDTSCDRMQSGADC
jgi:tRNA(Ile)-lysidine synthetase-like protein